MKLKINRYTHPKQIGFEGTIEPDCESPGWIIFFRRDGSGELYTTRTGADDEHPGACVPPSIQLPARATVRSAPPSALDKQIESILNDKIVVGDTWIVVALVDTDQESLDVLASAVAEDSANTAVMLLGAFEEEQSGQRYVTARTGGVDLHAGKWLGHAVQKAQGRGGGSDDRASGHIAVGQAGATVIESQEWAIRALSTRRAPPDTPVGSATSD